MDGQIYPLNTYPGIQKDGTEFAGKRFTDGQWVRFQRGLPRKIGGYVQIIGGLPHVIRALYVFPNSPYFNVYIGDYQSLKYLMITSLEGIYIPPLVDRTPVGFAVDVNNIWSVDSMFSTVSDASILIAHAAPNLAAIDSIVERPVYYGNTLDTTPLIETGFSTSGGIVVLHPFLFIFGNYGSVIWTDANDPTTFLGSARVTSQKIVAGVATRGGNSSPAGLLWSLDSVIRITEVSDSSGAINFRFDTVSNESSILSAKSIIENDGIYYWLGVDRFLTYNGVVLELENDTNRNFFFNDLNYEFRQKVWATKITEFGEIWWHYPSLNSINGECDNAIIYNYRERVWYDTSSARASGYYNQTFASPIWSDSDTIVDGNYSLWLHETGVDKVAGEDVEAILSVIETGSIAWCALGPTGQYNYTDRWVYLYRFEPDIIQSGDLTLIVQGRNYARDKIVSTSYVISDTDIKTDIHEQRREMTLRFVSDAIGGNYQFGQNLVVMKLGDGRQ